MRHASVVRGIGVLPVFAGGSACCSSSAASPRPGCARGDKRGPQFQFITHQEKDAVLRANSARRAAEFALNGW
jgi:hypothetical protein